MATMPVEQLPREATTGTTRPLIETVTLNGFRILRPSDVGDTAPEKSLERRFIVKSPDGQEHDVRVEIDEESVAYVERMTRRKLPPESSFWTLRAQKTLSTYLWDEGRTPPGGRLKMKEVDRDELQIATHWKGD
jgi:hypothetical protein